MQVGCTGSNLEYLDENTCLVMCATFGLGPSGDTYRDTLACRTYYAQQAAAGDAAACRPAGPLGAGACGNDLCEPFCDLTVVACGDLAPYDDAGTACLSECHAASFPYLTSDVGDLTVETGNSFNCRLYHLELASERPALPSLAIHCDGLGVVSALCQ